MAVSAAAAAAARLTISHPKESEIANVIKRSLVGLAIVCGTVSFHASAPIRYRLSFPEPQHRWMQVEATFDELGSQTLELRMSRSSPGRYSLHDFAKNVYDVHTFAADGRELPATRPDPYGWNVAGHGGSVTVKYKVFGDRVDGTYLAVDTTHAHVNMPAAIMWAHGLDDRPATVTFEQPAGMRWHVATQLHGDSSPSDPRRPVPDSFTFTAPNLQYLMDSPAEFGPGALREFRVGPRTFRFALHHTGTDAEIDGYMKDVETIIRQEGAIYGEYPEYEPGSYTFLADYLPYANGDGMEHRNSTVVTAAGTIAGDRTRLLDTVAHEFFHCWNVKRIRPKTLEPFNFEKSDMSHELWFAEGFTQYYGDLLVLRSGVGKDTDYVKTTLSGLINVKMNTPGARLYSPVEASRKSAAQAGTDGNLVAGAAQGGARQDAGPAAVGRHHPVAQAAGRAGHPDDRLVERHRPRRTEETGIAEGEDPPVGGHQPVAPARRVGSHPDDGLVQFEVAGGAEEPGPAEGEDPSVGAGQEVAGFVVVDDGRHRLGIGDGAGRGPGEPEPEGLVGLGAAVAPDGHRYRLHLVAGGEGEVAGDGGEVGHRRGGAGHRLVVDADGERPGPGQAHADHRHHEVGGRADHAGVDERDQEVREHRPPADQGTQQERVHRRGESTGREYSEYPSHRSRRS